MVGGVCHSFCNEKRCDEKQCSEKQGDGKVCDELKVCLSLIGFSGAGKTAVTECLSSKYGLRCIDLDVAIEQHVGRLVSDIIGVEGIEAFRVLEKEVLTSLLKKDYYQVFSLGGGALLSAEVKELVTMHTLCIELVADGRTIVKRVYYDEVLSLETRHAPLRPLLAVDAFSSGVCGSLPSLESVARRVASLQSERAGLYSCAKLVVWTDFVSSDEVSRVLLDEVSFFESFSCLGFRRNVFPRVSFSDVYSNDVSSNDVSSNGVSSNGYGGGESRFDTLVVGYGVVNELVDRVLRQHPDVSSVCLLYESGVGLFVDDLISRFSHASIEVISRELLLNHVGALFSDLSFVESSKVCILLRGGGDYSDVMNSVSCFFRKFDKLFLIPTSLLTQISGCADLVGSFSGDVSVLIDPSYVLQSPRDSLQDELVLVNNVYRQVVSDLFGSLQIEYSSLCSCDDSVFIQFVERCICALHSLTVSSGI